MGQVGWMHYVGWMRPRSSLQPLGIKEGMPLGEGDWDRPGPGWGSLPTHSVGREVPWWSLCLEARSAAEAGREQASAHVAPAGAQ